MRRMTPPCQKVISVSESHQKFLLLLYLAKIRYLTTITTVVGIQVLFVPSKLKICQLYHEKLLLQKVDDMYTQVLTYVFTASDILEAV